MNIRHDLDNARVSEQVLAKVAEHEIYRVRLKKQQHDLLEKYKRLKVDGTSDCWSRQPPGPEYVDPMIDDWISREQLYYALVRVIELPQPGKRFILVYGEEDDSTVSTGTGPFESFIDAKSWFFNGGR